MDKGHACPFAPAASLAERLTSSIVARGRRCVVLAAIAASLAVVTRAAPAQALAVCTTSISTCCKITSANTYSLTASVTALAGGDCIQIAAPGVTLDLNGFDMIGFNNVGLGTGVGIHALAAATGTVINGGADLTSLTPSNISNFTTGIRNDAPNSFIFDFVVENNIRSGVINNGTNAMFAEFQALHNNLLPSVTAAVVDNASRATFLNFSADNNLSDGIDINSPAPPAAPTNNVRLLNFDATRNGGTGVSLTATGALIGSTPVFNGIINSVIESGTVSNNDVGVSIYKGSGNTLS